MEPKDRATPPDARARHRAFVLEHVMNGGLTIEQAAAILSLSTRQVGRLLTRSTDGPASLEHGNRGRTPANRLDDALRARLVELATTTYDGVNRAHLAELLAEREGLEIAPRTLRRILAEAAVQPVRTRRSPRHRSRRERMAREGMLLQVDGSRHRWFGRDYPFTTLVAGIDDATSRVSGGTFRAAEDAAGYFTTFAQTADRYGLPGATYSDRHGIFVVERNRPATLAEQLTGKRSFTQVGRALEAAGIGWIGAHSAEAKGRIERLWNTLQDRLVTELRLEGITAIEDANGFLPGFLLRHNARFAVPAADPALAWRPWPEGLSTPAVFCFHYPRRVANDSTISWPDGDLALPRRSDGRSWAGRSVILQERLDGSLWISEEDICVPVRPAPADTGQLRARRFRSPSDRDPAVDLAERLDPGRPSAPQPPGGVVRRPGPDHPWRGRRDRS
jgi:transposase